MSTDACTEKNNLADQIDTTELLQKKREIRSSLIPRNSSSSLTERLHYIFPLWEIQSRVLLQLIMSKSSLVSDISRIRGHVANNKPKSKSDFRIKKGGDEQHKRQI